MVMSDEARTRHFGDAKPGAELSGGTRAAEGFGTGSAIGGGVGAGDAVCRRHFGGGARPRSRRRGSYRGRAGRRGRRRRDGRIDWRAHRRRYTRTPRRKNTSVASMTVGLSSAHVPATPVTRKSWNATSKRMAAGTSCGSAGQRTPECRVATSPLALWKCHQFFSSVRSLLDTPLLKPCRQPAE